MNSAWVPPSQPDDFVFDAESETAITIVLKKYPVERKASAVMPLLYIAQKQMGRCTGSAWVPLQAMNEIAKRLEMAPIRVYEVASFYTMFNKRPIGRYHLQVCTTTPCWLRGSDEIVSVCRRETGINHFGETSVDGLFTLTEVECLGACANAPILQVDDDFYEDVDSESVRKLIAELRDGRRPAPGPRVDRLNSAPEGGRKTLLTVSTPVDEQ
ncbi:MAG: NAD(P)H-dependent oxidoreductase subunit E [Acetobacter sp.]|nr:NAD(P)H-dependent oxidoreductase subunit E [Acetobacter sp.]